MCHNRPKGYDRGDYFEEFDGSCVWVFGVYWKLSSFDIGRILARYFSVTRKTYFEIRGLAWHANITLSHCNDHCTKGDDDACETKSYGDDDFGRYGSM
jgi:hypothetical protein